MVGGPDEAVTPDEVVLTCFGMFLDCACGRHGYEMRRVMDLLGELALRLRASEKKEEERRSAIITTIDHICRS